MRCNVAVAGRGASKPFILTRSNKRSPGPAGEFETLPEALAAVQTWIASMGFMGEEMAGSAGLEIHGASGVVWTYRERMAQ